MKQLPKPANLPPELLPIWQEMAPAVDPSIGSAGLEALCTQIYRMRDARQRITQEGIVVADAKGNAAPHPALTVERSAQDEIRKWLSRYGRR